jgi:hypothetical protein
MTDVKVGARPTSKGGPAVRQRWSARALTNSPATPPALPERIEAVLQFREWGDEVITISLGNRREPLKEIAMSQDHNHLNHATWECKHHVVSEGEELDLDCAEH